MQFRKSWIMALALTSVVALSACGNGGNNAATNNGGTNAAATNTPTESSGAKLSGSILASGSTALQPLVEMAAEGFMDANAGVDIQVQGGGSGTGLTQVAEKQVDIGNSDVFAEEKLKDADAEKAKSLVDHQVAVVAIAAVSNPKAGVDSLTKQQLVDIFTGKLRTGVKLAERIKRFKLSTVQQARVHAQPLKASHLELKQKTKKDRFKKTLPVLLRK